MIEKQTRVHSQLKLTTGHWKTSNDLDELAPKPAIQLCDTGQWIPCCDTRQLTTVWMSIIS